MRIADADQIQRYIEDTFSLDMDARRICSDALEYAEENIGEDSLEAFMFAIFGSFGFDESDIDALREDGAIR